jgi:hypothetical protein
MIVSHNKINLQTENCERSMYTNYVRKIYNICTDSEVDFYDCPGIIN